MLGNENITHAAFLIGTDLFEYGTSKKAMVVSIVNYSEKIFNNISVKFLIDNVKIRNN